MRRERRTVLVADSAPRRGATRLWAYGYAELSALFGMTVRATRKAAERGHFDPADLRSIINYHEARGERARPSPGPPMVGGS